MRIIDADALKELYEMGEELKDYEKLLSVPLPVIQQNIKDMPTIDAAPVVRCGECLFKRPRKEYGELHCRILDAPMNNNDFCSYGERRVSEDGVLL